MATTAAAAVAATPASASDLVPALVIERPKRQPKGLSRVEKDDMHFQSQSLVVWRRHRSSPYDDGDVPVDVYHSAVFILIIVIAR